ncbi:MAG: hypothetical protein K6C09_00440 [Oscillospiraceae bacterium]|nr:hypothetical protein [Oscillospiraceae bacterium]
MKRLQIAFILLFFLLLAVPMAAFSRGEGIVSEIDNRMLAENPLRKDVSIDPDRGLSGMLEDYISDRIGFRSGMIRFYTRIHDKLFGIMIHPTYTYGKDGFVFFRNPGDGPECTEYHRIFADMAIRIQQYCEERDVPFLFVFNPIKNAVLQDKLAEGVNFNNDWKKEFFSILDENDVRYVDNTDLLREKSEAGETVFNQKYDAGHWNDLGAFYGVNNMLSALQEDFPVLKPNRQSEYAIEQRLRTSLRVSEFPIHEYEPVYTMKGFVEDMTEQYDGEVKRESGFDYFRYTINEDRRKDGAPRTLVFQGSYMINQGYKFLDNRLGEYIAVHDYQNVTRFDYYYNLFQPECVIFEVGEYVFSDRYFDRDAMKAAQLNPPLSSFEGLPEVKMALESGQIRFESGKTITTVTVSDLPGNTTCAYLIMDGVSYDMHREEGVYTLAVLKEVVDTPTVVAYSETDQTLYVLGN